MSEGIPSGGARTMTHQFDQVEVLELGQAEELGYGHAGCNSGSPRIDRLGGRASTKLPFVAAGVADSPAAVHYTKLRSWLAPDTSVNVHHVAKGSRVEREHGVVAWVRLHSHHHSSRIAARKDHRRVAGIGACVQYALDRCALV